MRLQPEPLANFRNHDRARKWTALVAGGLEFEKSAGALVPIATAELYKP